MYGYVADIQRVAPFCALIELFPACGRASFVMRKSPFRDAKEPFPMTGRDVPEERKSPFGMFWMPPLLWKRMRMRLLYGFRSAAVSVLRFCVVKII